MFELQSGSSEKNFLWENAHSYRRLKVSIDVSSYVCLESMFGT